MTSFVSISATIDHLILRIDQVKVCQAHLRLISTSLTRLQHGLNHLDSRKDDRHSYENIIQTLKAIDEVIISCSENESELEGMTYRDLESLLLRLQLRLAQHEVDLTDHYETKVQILSNIHHEQQIIIQKVFDETIKQRLDTIYQRTKETTKEQLRLLSEKHFSTIKQYLRCCIEQHKSVPLTGLTGNIIAKVAHTFYQISSKDQIQLEQNWQSCELPLTRTFIQFKPDKSTSFERNESRRLLMGQEVNLLQRSHSRKDASKGIWQRLVSAPYMMSMVERDRYAEENDVSEENIIRTKRWIVILGDPGSGKTSFARWLVRHLAQTLLLNGQHSTDYGPLRIPILIRVGEFAEMLNEQPSLTLFDYIGKHKWMGKAIVNDPSNSLDDLSCAFQDYIKQGQALILLDGLDEIPVSNQRSKIINIVESFVDTYVQTPTGASALDNPHLNRLFDDPSKSGGNQLIVTSRIVGYHAAPLAGQFAHYTIRPMDIEHMKDFVDYWFFRVHQHVLDSLVLPLTNKGESHGEALKKELEKTDNIGLLDVASNSCLMSFICSVAFSQLDGSPLPTQRISLYEQIVNSMLSLWSSKRSTIPIPDLIRILSEIATYIHENSASGLIHEEKMKEVCIQSIKTSLNKNAHTEEHIPDIESQASEFVRIIREDVGILAARGESLYGFLHLTFQEYFTCLKLIDIDKTKQEISAVHVSCAENKVELVARSLHRHVYDPRFRVPVALALGKLSSFWSPKDFDDFCLAFIQDQDKAGSLLPLGAYLLISCSNDLVNYPSDDVLFYALDCLIVAAGQHKWSLVCPFLIDQIRAALKKLRNNIVLLWINNFLSRSPSYDIQTISALCHLIEGKPHEFENIKWLNQSSCLILQSFATLDNESNAFAIDRLLVKVTFINHRLLPVDRTTFKGFLLSEEIELNSIPVALFSLIISLYGGLKRDGQAIVFDPFHIHRESTAVTPILVNFLSRKVCEKQDENILTLKQECLSMLLAQRESCDESCQAVDLCIATICLYGIEYVQDNLIIIPNSVLRMAMNRLRYVSMILRQFYFTGDENDCSIENETTKFISVAIQKLQYGKSSKMQFLDLLNSLRSGLARLRSSHTSVFFEGELASYRRMTLHMPNSLRIEYKLLDDLLPTEVRFYSDRKSCSMLHHFTKLFWILEHNDEFETQYRMAVAVDSIAQYLLFRNDEDFFSSLTFIPSHLRDLYLQLLKQELIIVNSKDFAVGDRRHLYFGHILVECLILLSNGSCKSITLLAALVTLLPWLRMHQLENFASSLLWTIPAKYSDFLTAFEMVRQRPLHYETGLYINKYKEFPNAENMTDEQRRTLVEQCIEQEHQRLRDALINNEGESMKLYSACVSLTRVCQWSQGESRLILLKDSIQGAMSIKNKLARFDALCVIAFYCQSDYNQIEMNNDRSLQEEIEYQLNDIHSDLPLLIYTAIFIRCLPLLQNQQLINKCLQTLFNKFNDADQRDQQAVYEALSPYLQSNPVFYTLLEHISNSFVGYNRGMNNKSSGLKEYLNADTNENLSNSLLVSNLYLAELVGDFYGYVATNDLRLMLSHSNHHTIHKSITYTSLQFVSPILTIAQAMAITSVLSSISTTSQTNRAKRICDILGNVLHHFNLVEFKACRLLEYWMRWKDSNELSTFAYHAALLLTNSDSWSIEAATILCTLLCSENDRFRQRAEIILRSDGDENNIRTSSKLGIDVLLTLITRKAHYQRSSPSANLTLARAFENISVDVPSHLEALLWLERYRIHALTNKEYFLSNSTLSPITHLASYFSNNTTIDVSLFGVKWRISNDLMKYICNLITSHFLSFLEIDNDTTSDAVKKSHIQFVVSVLVFLVALVRHTDEARPLIIDTLTRLFETSIDDEIRRAATYALGYVCDAKTYKLLFNRIQMIVNDESNYTYNYSDCIVNALISSYCYCVAVCNITFDQDDMDLFRKLLKHSSQNVVKEVHVGLGRVLKNNSLLFEMLDSDHIQCYHALVNSTACLFMNNTAQSNTDAVAEFIEKQPDLLSIFIVELYNSIRHFTCDVLHVKTADYCLAYGFPQYVDVTGLLAVRMPAAFCVFVNDWHDGDNLKRALFYTSKQHNYPQRAACLTILSVFGELTVELCEMFIEALSDDPYIQSTCYKCLTRINSIKDEKIVLNLLFSSLKSISVNVRYVATKMLLHLSKSSLIPSEQVHIALNDLMLDPSSNDDLWLIEEQDTAWAECVYYYAGPLKDVIYSLLVQHLTGDAIRTVRRNELNDIDADFVESENASRLSACLYEKKTEENIEMEIASEIKSID